VIDTRAAAHTAIYAAAVAKKLGNDYRLFIGDGAGTEVFTEIKGQQNLSITRNGATIDTSTKDNAPYGTQAPGLRTCRSRSR
jgi:hypothetical protein